MAGEKRLQIGRRIAAAMIIFSVVLWSGVFLNCTDNALTLFMKTRNALINPKKVEKNHNDSSEITIEATETAKTQTETKTESKNQTSSVSKTKEKKAGDVISQFFTPYKANTSYNNTYMNNQSGVKISIKDMLESKLNLGYVEDSAEPQVLIMHTHGTENYLPEDRDYYTDSDLKRTKDEKFSVVGVGAKLKKELEAKGIGVVHDKTLHDSPSYSGSYTRSSAAMEENLKKYKNIKIVLDIHRDAIADGKNIVRPVVEIDGKEAAQVMICVGSETGIAEGFPNWKENLKLGLNLQQTTEVLYPGLARPLFLAYERIYNQDVSTKALIIEFGTNANTFSQAEYSAELMATAIATVLKNE